MLVLLIWATDIEPPHLSYKTTAWSRMPKGKEAAGDKKAATGGAAVTKKDTAGGADKAASGGAAKGGKDAAKKDVKK